MSICRRAADHADDDEDLAHEYCDKARQGKKGEGEKEQLVESQRHLAVGDVLEHLREHDNERGDDYVQAGGDQQIQVVLVDGVGNQQEGGNLAETVVIGLGVEGCLSGKLRAGAGIGRVAGCDWKCHENDSVYRRIL